jgi:ABC-2 type transport system permease protein
MNRLLSAELLKLRTTRAFYVALFVVLAFATALPFVIGATAGSGDVEELTARSLLDLVRAPVQVAGAAVLLIGLLASAGEYRHRTVLLSRLAQPRSGRLLLAKLSAIALVGVVVGVVVDALSLVVGSVVLHQHGLSVQPLSHGVPRVLLLVPVSLALYGIFGLAVGSVVRSTAGAVGAVLVWAFVIEGALPLVFHAPHLGDRLPSGAFVALLRTGATETPATAAALLVGYAVVLVAAAAIVERRREL